MIWQEKLLEDETFLSNWNEVVEIGSLQTLYLVSLYIDEIAGFILSLLFLLLLFSLSFDVSDRKCYQIYMSNLGIMVGLFWNFSQS